MLFLLLFSECILKNKSLELTADSALLKLDFGFPIHQILRVCLFIQFGRNRESQF